MEKAAAKRPATDTRCRRKTKLWCTVEREHGDTHAQTSHLISPQSEIQTSSCPSFCFSVVPLVNEALRLCIEIDESIHAQGRSPSVGVYCVSVVSADSDGRGFPRQASGPLGVSNGKRVAAQRTERQPARGTRWPRGRREFEASEDVSTQPLIWF